METATAAVDTVLKLSYVTASIRVGPFGSNTVVGAVCTTDGETVTAGPVTSPVGPLHGLRMKRPGAFSIFAQHVQHKAVTVGGLAGLVGTVADVGATVLDGM